MSSIGDIMKQHITWMYITEPGGDYFLINKRLPYTH